jgi:hypothetical protein
MKRTPSKNRLKTMISILEEKFGNLTISCFDYIGWKQVSKNMRRVSIYIKLNGESFMNKTFPSREKAITWLWDLERFYTNVSKVVD